MHRFLGNFDLSQSTVTVNDSDVLHQWQRVLRFGEGDEIVLADGKSQDVRAKFISLSKNQASLAVVSREENKREPKRRVHLYAAILKRENFDLLVQKAVEAGVAEITPLLTQRTVKLNIKKDRLQAIAKEAAEQSGRAIVPVIHEPMRFADALSQAGKNTAYFLHIDAPKLAIALKQETAAIFVGPEGGWSEEEVAQAKPALTFAGLGTTVLRAETAAIVASFLAAQG